MNDKTINDKSDPNIDLVNILLSVVEEKLFRYDCNSDKLTLISLAADSKKLIQVYHNFTSDKSLIDEKDRSNVIKALRYASATPTKGEVEFRSGDFSDLKKGRWYKMKYSSSFDSDNSIKFLSGRIDCIEREKNLIRTIREAAESDKLTGMYSYEKFCEKFNAAVKNDSVSEGFIIYAHMSNLRNIASEFNFDFADNIIRRYAKSIKSWYGSRYIIGREKTVFYLFCPKNETLDIIHSECQGLVGLAKGISSDISEFDIEMKVGFARYPQDSDNIRSLIICAEQNALNVDQFNQHLTDDIKPEKFELLPETADTKTAVAPYESSLTEKLIEFNNTLFYSFKPFGVMQNALAKVAPSFGLCGITVHYIDGNPNSTVKVLYKTDFEIDEKTPFEEHKIFTLTHNTNLYRLYKYPDSAPFTPYQNKMANCLVNMIHTFINRYESIKTAKFAKNHDMLFGCMNSVGFSQKLEELQKKGIDFSNYAFIFANVKSFKTINERVGFNNGNAVINMIIDYFQKKFDSDECFARIGGDNFALFLNKNNIENKISAINSLKCEIMYNDTRFIFDISFRMGVYLVEPHTTSIEDMRENSAIAYSFTRNFSGSDVVYYSRENRVEYERRTYFTRALAPALENNEFLVYFQPKVDLETYEIIGAEALSRWNKDGYILPPDSFIPIFVENGTISKIDFYVFEKVCQTISEWIAAGIKPVTISVNFEKTSLETPDFASYIYTIAQKYGTPVEYLEIEFTETSCMENESKFNDILADLKRYKFRASLDDFGKGYSSINMLKKMNFDILKLDRSFLSEERDLNDRSEIILRSVIDMAHNLDIKVISEGVETIEHVNSLKGLKCESAQGYFFDKPLPKQEFTDKLRIGKYTV